MMQRGKLGGYNCDPFASPFRRWAKHRRINGLPPLRAPASIVDSLLKQFALTSQLGANAAYIEELYEQYLVDPDSVAPSWKAYFDGLKGREAGDVPHSVVMEQVAQAGRDAGRAPRPRPPARATSATARSPLITAYRSRGHLAANLDPLGMQTRPDAPDLALGFHRLSESDLDHEFGTGGVGGRERMKLRDLLALLKATYTGSIGAEYMHIADVEQRRWMQDRLETAGGNYGLDAGAKRRILERLTAAEGLERYLHTKYVGQKRFRWKAATRWCRCWTTWSAAPAATGSGKSWSAWPTAAASTCW